jgi:hypothetical protein
MNEIRVYNKHHKDAPPNVVYIGRGSPWGNPFVIGQHGDRPAVILKYKRWLTRQPHLLSRLDELRGKPLMCFCAPQECHGDGLIELANSSDREAVLASWASLGEPA